MMMISPDPDSTTMVSISVGAIKKRITRFAMVSSERDERKQERR